MRKNIGKNYLYVLKKLIVKQTNELLGHLYLEKSVNIVLKHLSIFFGRFTRWIDPTNNLSFQVNK